MNTSDITSESREPHDDNQMVAQELHSSWSSERKTSVLFAALLLGTALFLGILLLLAMALDSRILSLGEILANRGWLVVYLAIVLVTALAGLDSVVDALARRPVVVFVDKVVLPRKRRSGFRLEDDIIKRTDVEELSFERLAGGIVCHIRTRRGERAMLYLILLDRPAEAATHLKTWNPEHGGSPPAP